MWPRLMAPIQLQANGRSSLPSDRRTTEDQHADKFSSAHHSRVPDTNLAVAALRQVHVAIAGVVLAPVHHVRLHTSTFQRPGANAIRSQHARASAKIPPPARASRAVSMRWVEYYLAHALSTAVVVDTDLRGARTGYQNAEKLPCLRPEGNVRTRRARSCKHRTPNRRAQTNTDGAHRVAGVLIAGETVVGAAEGVVFVDYLRSTNRARLACGACHREPASAGQPAPARTLRALRRTRGQRDGFVRRTTCRRRACARGGEQRAGTLTRLVKSRMVWNLHCTSPQGGHGKRRRHGKHGAVLVSPTQIAPATRRASEWGSGSSTRGRRQGARCRALALHMQTRRSCCRVWRCTRTFPSFVFYFGARLWLEMYCTS